MFDLRALQLKEIEILQAVHEVCERLNIEYVIMHGTLLGAVRHSGFIPWDDDIDICMTRENYDIFVRDGHKFLPNNLKIQHIYYEQECPNIFAKVRDCNTIFLQEELVNLNINQGVFIDIFPIEKIKSNKILISIEYIRRTIFRFVNQCYELAYIKTIKRKSSKIIGYMIHYILIKGIMRGINHNKYIQMEDNRRRRLHNKGDDCTFISILRKRVGKYSFFTDRKLYNFENFKFYGPTNYEEILSILYGDYMVLPPKEKQKAHNPFFVDLCRGYSKDELDNIIKEKSNNYK